MKDPPSAIPWSTVWLIWITATAASSGSSGIERRARKLAAKKMATATPAPRSCVSSPLNSTSTT